MDVCGYQNLAILKQHFARFWIWQWFVQGQYKFLVPSEGHTPPFYRSKFSTEAKLVVAIVVVAVVVAVVVVAVVVVIVAVAVVAVVAAAAVVVVAVVV